MDKTLQDEFHQTSEAAVRSRGRFFVSAARSRSVGSGLSLRSVEGRGGERLGKPVSAEIDAVNFNDGTLAGEHISSLWLSNSL